MFEMCWMKNVLKKMKIVFVFMRTSKDSLEEFNKNATQHAETCLQYVQEITFNSLELVYVLGGNAR